MVGVCQDPEGQYFVWQHPFYLATHSLMMSSSNPTIDVTVNEIELGALLMQLLIFAPRMVSLAHIHTYVNNTV